MYSGVVHRQHWRVCERTCFELDEAHRRGSAVPGHREARPAAGPHPGRGPVQSSRQSSQAAEGNGRGGRRAPRRDVRGRTRDSEALVNCARPLAADSRGLLAVARLGRADAVARSRAAKMWACDCGARTATHPQVQPCMLMQCGQPRFGKPLPRAACGRAALYAHGRG